MITTVSTFTASPLNERIDHYMVSEGKFAVAPHNPEKPYITTMGLYVCKAIAIHNPATQRGLLAHLAYTPDLEGAIDTIMKAYGPEVEAADVRLVRANEGKGPNWPHINDVARTIARYNPQSVTMDINPAGHLTRGVALNLAEGSIHELDQGAIHKWSGSHSLELNQYINPS